MFSALKKLTSKQDVPSVPPDTAGHPMAGSLQKKFSRGVNYNMKIIIKGDRNVGKSCLLQRLQGGGFIETYSPTEEIQVASIQWSFKATEDIVKVEVWDVVDRGKARPRHSGLKLSTAALPETPALDAEFLDVYKGTHGVILMMDVTKAWTFDYVCKELPKVPSEIPVLILGNHCDMGHHRVITAGQATSLIESYGEGRPAEILYAESSMRNGFGLRLLHKFLGLPFLRLQKETLLALIERNKRDTDICSFEIAEFLKSEDSDYNKFLNNLSNKRRQIADSNSCIQSNSNLNIVNSMGSNSSSSSSSSQKNIPIQLPIELKPTKSIIVGGGQPIIISGQVNLTQGKEQQTSTGNNSNITANLKTGIQTGTAAQSNAITKTTNLATSLLKKVDIGKDNISSSEIRQISIGEKISSVEEFCPDEGVLDRSFLDDIFTAGNNEFHNQMMTTSTTAPMTMTSSTMITITKDESDSDNEIDNPMVAKFNDDPDIDELIDNNKSDPIKGCSVDNTSNNNNNNNGQKTKVNPLAKHRKSGDFSNNIILRKVSISSEELPGIPVSSYDPSYEENSDSWLAETAIRRSPEGGEDSGSVPSINQDLSKLDDKNSDKKSKHKKKKEKKDKDERKEKKKKKQRSKENELEDFLSGTVDNSSRVEGAYEAI